MKMDNLLKKGKFYLWAFFISFAMLFISASTSSYCNTSSNGTTTCYPCYYRCKDCSGVQQTQCTSCLKQYIFVNSTCLSCGENCFSCKIINQTSNLNPQNIQSQCETCIEGYYLSQSSGRCIKCPTGAQTCTLSAIQACSDGYYESNGVCFQCQSHCASCSSSTKCHTCLNYFYLDSNANCSSCHTHRCMVCDSTSNCISCEEGYSGSDCSQLCPENCAICYSGSCFVCKSNFYMSNGICLPNTLLCKIGSSYGQCDECINDLAYLSDSQRCIPMNTVHDENRLIYLTAINNWGQFWSSFPQQLSNNSDSKSLVLCQPPISMIKSLTKNIYVAVEVEPCYKISVKSQLLSSALTFDLQVWRNQLILSRSSITLNQSSGKGCNGQSYFLLNYGFEFDMAMDFNSSSDPLVLQFAFDSSQTDIGFGVSEVYLQLFRCQIKNCLMCKSAYTCQSCMYPFRLQNNECLKQCEEGYYLTEWDSLGVCTLDCLKGYFAVRQDYSCQKCQWPCVECQDIAKCLKCYHNDANATLSSSGESYFLYNSTCVKQCPDKYFADLLTYSCEECVFPCSLCANLTSCSTCRMGYLNLDISRCVVNCPQSTFADFVQLKCSPCSAPCNSCFYSASTCTQCDPPLYLLDKNNSCLASCPKEYSEVNSAPQYCSQCQFPCKTCLSSPENCTSCIKGYFFNNTCLGHCPSKYYEQTTSDFNNLCQQCQNNCLECQDQTVCTSCKHTFWFNPREKQCVTQCPKGTYEVIKDLPSSMTEKRCEQCIPPCLDCSNETYCLSCTGLLFLNHLGQCLLECPRGTYIYYNPFIEERQCMQCEANCLSCLSNINCYECKEGWFLWEGICYTKCPETTFSNQNGYKFCLSCQYPCQNCVNQYQCSSCVSGFLYQMDELKCVQFCVDGYFENTTDWTCLKCSSECEKCIWTADNCLNCAAGYFYNYGLQKCTTECPAGTYYSSIERKCRDCQFPCRTCVSFMTCASCYQLSQISTNSSLPSSNLPFILYLGQCISQCPQHYFQIQTNSSISTCSKCEFPCQDCSLSSTNCTKCRIPSITVIMSNNASNTSSLECGAKCPEGYYAKSFKCELCEQPCKECSSVSYCFECMSGWYLLEGECFQMCPYHFYPTIVNNIAVCDVCSDQCKQCEGIALNCTQCSQNYYLLSGSVCVKDCPVQFYASSKNMNCIPCQTPCLDCYSELYCKSCRSGYLMQETKCVLSCDSKYYLQSLTPTVCTLCEPPCQKCKSAHQCLSCMPGFYYLDRNLSCLKQCPSKMYGHAIQFVSSSSSIQGFKGVCLQCSQLCQQCSSYSVCLSCNASGDLKYLEESKCQTSCSDGYCFSNDTNAYYPFNCHKCKHNCLSCTSSDTCLKCFSSYLYQNQCLSKCPSFYYPSTSYTCEKCLSPCQQCYNQYNCLNCVEGYFLYKSICVKRCPSNYWNDIDLRLCVTNCSQHKFLNAANKTCLISCQKFYSHDSYCLDSCRNPTQSYNFINQTLGCQTCQFQDKTICLTTLQKLSYSLEYIVLNGKLLLVIKFGGLMKSNADPFNANTTDAQKEQLETVFNFSYAKKQLIHQQLNLNFINAPSQTSIHRNINSSTPSSLLLGKLPFFHAKITTQPIASLSKFPSVKVKSNSSDGLENGHYPTLVKNLSNSLWLQFTSLPSDINAFSGFLNYQIQHYLKLVSAQTFQLSQTGNYQNLPLQQISLQKIQLKSFSPERKLPQWILSSSSVIAKVLSCIILVLILVNLTFDNLKSQFHLIDFSQNLFIVLWMIDKVEFSIFPFLKGFSLINFSFQFTTNDSSDFLTNVEQLLPSSLWNCNLKQIVYGNSCSFLPQFISLGASIAIFLIIIASCRLLIHFKPLLQSIIKTQHKFIYNHVNNFYWLFVSPIFYLSSSSFVFNDSPTQKAFKIDLILMAFCGILTLVLGYQLLKNIFNCSFEEKTFFWGLKCHRTENTQSNVHFLLLMIRKSIFLISLVFMYQSEEKELVYFFLIVLVSVVLLSNILANSPFKKKSYQIMLVSCEILGILFHLGIEIYIVNVKKFDSQTFIAYNSFLVISAVLIISIHLIISVMDTYKTLRNYYRKYKSLEGDGQASYKSESSYESEETSGKDGKKKKSERHSKDQKDFSSVPAQFFKKRKQNQIQKKLQSSEKGKSELEGEMQTGEQKSKRKSEEDERESSSTFSDLKFEKGSGEFQQPARYLIKLEKHPTDNDL